MLIWCFLHVYSCGEPLCCTLGAVYKFLDPLLSLLFSSFLQPSTSIYPLGMNIPPSLTTTTKLVS